MNQPNGPASRPARPVSTVTASSALDPLEAWRFARSTARIREASELTSDMHVLEIGCGDGALTAHLAGSGARISAVDPQVRLVAAARRRQLAEHVRFRAEHPEHLLLEDASFDVAVGINVLARFGTEACLRELARVLRPGGRIVFVEPNRSTSRKSARPAPICRSSLRSRLVTCGFSGIELRPFARPSISARRCGGRPTRWERVIERLPFMGAAAELLLVTAARDAFSPAGADSTAEPLAAPVLCS
jgi:SAM-dependent methyltransferase